MTCGQDMQAVVPNPSAADPAKHVRYNLGMVLGVDDFMQEFTYHNSHRAWLARDLLGYGTAWGLRVVAEDNGEKGPRILVECGAALSPRGQLMHVSPAQCAYLNEWLAANRAAVSEKLGATPVSGTPLTLYVCLAYDECATDDVPLAGEPCRSDDQLTAPSRTQDHFKLKLCLDPPAQTEEDALRNFVQALAQVAIVPGTAGEAALTAFEEAVRQSPQAVLSPPSLCDYAFPSTLSIPGDQAAEYLRAAFRIWTVELRPRCRPQWLVEDGACAAGGAPLQHPDPEDYLQLARLDLPITVDGMTNPSRWSVASASVVEVNERERPYLLHLRMLQEWLLSVRAPTGAPGMMSLESPSGVVAAGFIRGDNLPDGPATGNLRVVPGVSGVSGVDGQLVFTFNGYQVPNGTFQYIVKAMAVPPPPIAPAKTQVMSVRFIGYRPEGIVLRVTRGATLLTLNVMESVKYMLEISRIG
jgi:hypothetical protein